MGLSNPSLAELNLAELGFSRLGLVLACLPDHDLIHTTSTRWAWAVSQHDQAELSLKVAQEFSCPCQSSPTSSTARLLLFQEGKIEKCCHKEKKNKTKKEK